MSNICLGLLCGLPASGKSTLAVQIQDHVARAMSSQLCVLLFHYDSLIPASVEQQLIAQTDEQGGSLWKSMRIQITTCVDLLCSVLKHGYKSLTVAELIQLCNNYDDLYTPSSNCLPPDSQSHCLIRPSNVDAALWERFVSMLSKSLKKAVDCGKGCEGDSYSWLVLVDDNMHYSGMRYQYCQLARKYEAGLCIIYVACPLEEALQRNRSRAEGRVKDNIITVMNERLETPDSDKRPWEKYSATVSGMSTVNIQVLLQMVQEALMDPQQPSPEENTEEKVISRYICSTNAVHQADQILRRCVSLRMAEAKDAGHSREELKIMSAELSKIRTTILNDLRQGEITLAFRLDERDIASASRNSDSPLFQFVQTLFFARTADSL